MIDASEKARRADIQAAFGRHNQPRGERETWIGELVQCLCRHGVGRHGATGCEGDARGSCRCRLSRESALDVVVERERFHFNT